MTDRPWGATLGTLWRRGFTGELWLTHGSERAGVAFERGAIVGASATALTRDLRDAALRTFAIDRGEFVIDDRRTIPASPDLALATPAAIVLGARTRMPATRLATELAWFGVWFQLDPNVALAEFGFSDRERRIVEMLQGGCTHDDIAGAHADLGPTAIRAVLYALACCGACQCSREAPAAAVPAPAPSAPPEPPRRLPASGSGPLPALSRHYIVHQLETRIARGGDLFALLGLPYDAAPAQVRTAYLAIARQLRPALAVDENARRVFARASEAFAVLTDPARRAAYLDAVDDPVAPLVERARAEHVSGNDREAMRWYQRVLEVDPGHSEAHAELAKLEKQLR